MLTPGVVTLAPSAVAEAGPAGAAYFPPGAVDAIARWLAGEESTTGARNATALLDALRGGAPLPPALGPHGGWQAYFAALGLSPTRSEAEQLRRFQAMNPNVALEIETLAAEVARAQRLRDRAFSTLTDAQWAVLPDAVTLVASGHADALTPEQTAAIAAVDLAALVDAASLLSRAAADAPARLDAAKARDEAIAAAIPTTLRDPAAYDDPAALMRAAADGAVPVTTELTLEQAVRGLSILTQVAPESRIEDVRLLPREMQAPLAAILVAHSREIASADPKAGLVTLATLADQLPALTRAAYNLSIASYGVNSMRAHGQRPLEDLSPRGLTQPGLVLEDIFGVSARAPDVGFVDGLGDLHAALGMPFPEDRAQTARQLEAAYGPEFSTALGSVFAAYAYYQRTASPENPVVSRAEELRAAALPILARSDALTLDDILVLQESASAEQELRQAVGGAASALTHSILRMPSVDGPASSPVAPTRTAAADEDVTPLGPVLILGDKSSHLTQAAYPETYVIVIDLGGDDTYEIPVAGAYPGFHETALASIAIDLGGRDTYVGIGEASLGAAIGTPSTPTFAFLLDAAGDDSYRGGKASLGYGLDGLGFLVDVRGGDRYDATAGQGLAYAGTSSAASVAAGVIVDVLGNDIYHANGGFVRIEDSSASTATSAVMVDIAGSDEYRTACPRDASLACFGTPRPRNETVSAVGSVVFVDMHGNNTYPRSVDPKTTGENLTQQSDKNIDHARMNEQINVQPEADPDRYAFVADGRVLAKDLDRELDVWIAEADKFLLETETMFSQLPYRGTVRPLVMPLREQVLLHELIHDSDGDLVPDDVERALQRPPDDPTNPIPSIDDADSDGDGFHDLIETLLSTNRNDASDYPAGVPQMDPVPPLSPFPGGSNIILNLPGYVGIGGPGTTRFTNDYSLAIDLGMIAGDTEKDFYTGIVGANGHALDLAGNDEYTPRERGPDRAVPSLAAAGPGIGSLIGSEIASLVDLGGSDRYFARYGGLGVAKGSSTYAVAFFLDATSDNRHSDVYRSPLPQAQGFSDGSGRAYFIDIGGKDVHEAPTQGVTIGRTSAALFVDSVGDDVYDATVGNTPITAEKWDAYQGALPNAGFLGNPSVAVFMDLDGADRYYQSILGGEPRTDLAGRKENRLRATPLDGHSATDVSIFLDTNLTAKDDEDGTPAVVEDVLDTDSGDAGDKPLEGSSFHVHIPRLGLVVGRASSTTYRAGLDYALQVDLGGGDVYRNRAGASSVRFPVSLLVDREGDDVYDHASLSPLGEFAGARLAGAAMTTSHYVGAQGSGIFGVGVLRDEGGRNAFRAAGSREESGDAASSVVMGASQGSGILGVGVLSLGGSAGKASATATIGVPIDNSLVTDVQAVAKHGFARAYSQSQGAAVLGVGILASEAPSAPDRYELVATTIGSDTVNTTSGQGYGLMGVGILLDAGGDNAFEARDLAQGAAEAGATAGSFDPTAPDRHPMPFFTNMSDPFPTGPAAGYVPSAWKFVPERSAGQLLLPGVGNDWLNSTRRSQAYADGPASHALLLDAEGDDHRALRPSQQALPHLGQGVGVRGGVALLLDNRGNDKNLARGGIAVQGYGTTGTGLLVDLSGADEYAAGDLAQGVAGGAFTRLYAGTTTRVYHPSFGLLLDRMGNDVYLVPSGTAFQGAGFFEKTGTEPVAGTGVFLDAGGMDHYGGIPQGQSAGRTLDGNGWRWTQQDADDAGFRGVGADDAPTAVFQAVLIAADLAGIETTPKCAPTCQDTIRLKVSLDAPQLGSSITASGVTASAIDRVEFFDNSSFGTSFIGLAKQQPGVSSVNQGAFEVEFVSDALHEETGIPIHPDGQHLINALIYPRVGTPDAEGRRAAVEAEPIPAQTTIDLDNAPVGRTLGLGGANVSTFGGSTMKIRVDRDLDRCNGIAQCPALVQEDVKPLTSEWALPQMNRTASPTFDPTCTGACLPGLKVRSAGGQAHLTWSAPSSVNAEGYWVFREVPDGAKTRMVMVGYVDARVPTKMLPGETSERMWFVDTEPGDAKAYSLLTIYRSISGTLQYSKKTETYAAKTGPGPVTGLRAVGVEDAIKLAWNPVDGATTYTITRGGASGRSWTIPGTTFVDDTVTIDLDYTYTVRANAGTEASQITSLTVAARATPGHVVEARLHAVDDLQGAGRPILKPTHLGGMWTHQIPWDGKWADEDAPVPDGDYLLNTSTRDYNPDHDATTDLMFLRVDGTAPKTTIGLPFHVGGPFLEGASIRIPFTVQETGSGVKRTSFYVKVGQEPWPTTPIVIPNGTTTFTFNGARDGLELQIVAISEDWVGNVEGVTEKLPWKATAADGFARTLVSDRGRITSHVVDVSPPQARSSKPDLYARPNETVQFSLTVVDLGTGVRSVTFDARGESFPMFLTGGNVWVGQWKAHGPDGFVQIIANLVDNAGNDVSVPIGTVTVDGRVPTIASAQLTFPGGRIVGRPGETATLVVNANDAHVLIGDLNVTVETHNVSSVPLAYLRYDADNRVYSASFPVNALKAKEANVTLRVKDHAGNVANQTIRVILNNTFTTVTTPILTVGPDRVLVNFTTLEPVHSRIDYGTSLQADQRTPLGPLGTTHSVLVTGLKPDTDYFLMALGVTDSGNENRSEIVTFRTTSALNLTLVPVEGLPHSKGQTSIGVELRRFDGVAPDATLEAVLLAPRGAPRVIATGQAVAGSGTVALDLDGVRDGTYSVLVRARDGDLAGQSPSQVLVVDRVAPLLDLPEARAATKGATYSVGVEERGSGIDVSTITWTFGGRRCAAVLTGDTLSCAVPDLGLDLTVPMRLEVPDRSGNVASIELSLDVDSAAPVVANQTLGAADGSAHLRPGARGRVSVDVQDHGVRSVTADLTRFGGDRKTEMRHVGGTRYEATFDVPAATTEGPVTISVTAIDAAGQATVFHVNSRVDATPPTLLRGTILPQGGGEVIIALQIDEPARATVKAAGPAGEVQATSGDARITQLLTLKGFRAGVPLRATVTLVDQAGLTTTAVLDGKALEDKAPPAKVPNLRLQDLGEGRVLLRWDAATDDDGVAGYRVVRTVADRASVTLPLVAGLMLTDEVPLGVRVTYTVAAVDHAGNAGEVAIAEGSSASIPRLANGTVDPPTGGPGLFTFTVDLVDSSGTAPLVVVRVDGVTHPMTPDKADCRQGCRYTAVVLVGAETLTAGPHEYSFHVVSGAFRVAHPEIDTIVGPTVLQGEEPPLVGVLAAANQVPAGGLLVGALALAGAVGALVWIRRRKA